jgi:hypothetical protein
MLAVPKKWLSIPSLLVVGGLLIALAAVFAGRRGIDPSVGWGRGRIALFAFGLVMAIGAAAVRRDPGRAISTPDPREHPSRLQLIVQEYWMVIPISALVVLVYAWFISSGTWTSWGSPTRYYTDLARGFELGHLYLARNVSPRLLASPGPYNANTSNNLEFPLDLSYYQGKY